MQAINWKSFKFKFKYNLWCNSYLIFDVYIVDKQCCYGNWVLALHLHQFLNDTLTIGPRHVKRWRDSQQYYQTILLHLVSVYFADCMLGVTPVSAAKYSELKLYQLTDFMKNVSLNYTFYGISTYYYPHVYIVCCLILCNQYWCTSTSPCDIMVEVRIVDRQIVLTGSRSMQNDVMYLFQF